jgi:hydrogenase nickel incorporation protein HypA/HybF
MHEMALAGSIIDIGEAEARKRNAAAILRIKLRLGEFTGVVREALEFGFDVMKEGTLAESAAFEIESVPLRARCPECGRTAAPTADFCLLCSSCESPVEIVSGREMYVEYIDLD